jgi:UDP-N-acetylglucosamine:LPS N-acetylglucosamine transferase
MKICLVCSGGGHLFSMWYLKEFWNSYDHFWVTFRSQDTISVLKEEKMYFSYFPTNRNIKNLIRNIFLAVKILKKEKPDVILCTGAGVCVPFIFIGKLLKIRTIFIELLTRCEDLSLSAKLIYPVVDHLIVQWPSLTIKYKKAKFVGQYI